MQLTLRMRTPKKTIALLDLLGLACCSDSCAQWKREHAAPDMLLTLPMPTQNPRTGTAPPETARWSQSPFQQLLCNCWQHRKATCWVF